MGDMACSLGKGDGQISKKSGIRLGAEQGMITCPECGQYVPVKPDGWHTDWWTIEPHNQQQVYVIPEPSERAKEVIAILRDLSFEDEEAVKEAMGWDNYDEDSYG